MSGLFGSSTQNNASTGGGLFGSNPAQNNPTPGLFGSNANTNQPATGGGLFGSMNNQATQPSTGGGLFGSTPNQNAQNTGSGLFGSSTNAGQQPSGGGLFGATTSQTNPSNSLFGASTGNAQPSGGGLFGSNSSTNQNNTSSLFGATAGNAANQNGTSLFGNRPTTAAPNTTSLLAQTTPSPRPLRCSDSQISRCLGTQPSSPNNLSNNKQMPECQQSRTRRRSQIRSRLSSPNGIPIPYKVNTILKTYLYNSVDKAYAPFFYPDASRGEDEKSWEEALSNKPEMPRVEGADGPGMAYVPILCRGFKALGERVETQARFVQEMRARLHEMNNSLNAVMDTHQQRITTKIATARLQHQILSQRCLRLAVKVQVLRNRGYALDSAEEELRKTLQGLERQVMDAGFASREDEVWARMVAIRERARWLQEEGKRISSKLEDGITSGSAADGNGSNGVSETAQAQIRKILKDYDGQLGHLSRELQDVLREYEQWEAGKRR
ncbi:hypothetical protein MRB53_040736 [Persea americana]|nr:hypothetical protein MRB53_040736 [Persea americana]